MTDVFATAADARYGYHLVNLLASVKENSDVFDRIVVHDLGLSAHQRSLVESLRGVEIRAIPDFAPHWAQGFTWKPWIWTHLEADRIFYLDAGATVLRSLEPALAAISKRGHFLVSQGNELRDIVPSDYFEWYGLDLAVASRPYVAAGIIGFETGGEFWERVVLPTYDDCLGGRNLGFSAEDAIRRNQGLAYEDSPTIRDCPNFRWDQTILNIHVVKEFPEAAIAHLDEYAGARSRRDHPHQVIWAHRRMGSLRYLKRAPYSGAHAWRHRAFGAWWQIRWWLKLHEHLFTPVRYVLKARIIWGRAGRFCRVR